MKVGSNTPSTTSIASRWLSASWRSATASMAGSGFLVLGPTAHMTRSFAQIPRGDLFASRKPDVRLCFDIGHELAQRRDPVGLADDIGVQTDVHDAPARRSLRVELIEAELEHVDAVAGGQAAAREHVEVVDVVGIGHTDDRSMNGVDEIGLIVVEIVAIGDQTELLEE